MKIVIAPDSFKDALDALAVCDAIATGLRKKMPDAELVHCPLADGGEGSGRLLAQVLDANEHVAMVHDPLGRKRQARWWHAPDRSLAIVEMAEASGLALLDPNERDALRTTSFGTGELLRAAIDTDCKTIMLCVGGSATVDGGIGCLQALGWSCLDADGKPIEHRLSGGGLATIGGIRPPAWQQHSACADHATKARPAIEILCDVENPLLGGHGAARVFGPQKGASPEGVAQLESGLAHWADILSRATGRDTRDVPGSGAAGGLPAGLAMGLAAEIKPGFAEIARQLDLRGRLAGADWCITGEGRIDDQTGGGKVVAGVARLAGGLSVPTIALVGSAEPGASGSIEALAHSLGLVAIHTITQANTPLADALAATRDNLRRAASEITFPRG